MFDQTFVDAEAKTKRPLTIFVSFVMQCLFIAVLVLIPLIWTETLKPNQLTSFLVAARAAASTSASASACSQDCEGGSSPVRCRKVDGAENHPERDRQH